MSRTTRIRFLIVPLLLLQFWAAVWMAFNLPAHATPNELLNYEYIAVMRQIRGLPNRGLVDSEIRYTEWHQPPVYFTLAALVGLPLPVPRSPVNPPPPIEVEENPHYLATPQGNRNPVVHITPQSTPLLYTSRLAAALLGLVGVAALYRAGAQILSPSVGLLMASLLAFQPGYIHLSGSVNNDMPLTAVVAIVMAYSLLLLVRQERRPDDPPRAIAYVVLGLLGVAAILTKANGVFVLAFLAVVLLSSLLVYRQWGLTLKYGVATLVGLVPLWAGWLVLNSIRMRDALGLEGSLPVGQVLTLSPLDFVHLGPWLGPIWRSYWLDWSAGDVGYGPDWLYLFWAVAVAIMLLGWLAPVRSPSTGGITRRWSLVTPLVILGFLGISYLYFAVKALTVREAGFLVPEARWWLPGLPALAWLAAAGFARWWRAPRRRDIACLSAALVPPAILLGLILFHFPSLYPEAQLVDTVDPGAALSSPISYEGGLSLMGLQTGEMAPGEPVPLSLTWQADTAVAADLTVAVQLLALGPDGWQKLGEVNSYPGSGRSPTRGWPAGYLVEDMLLVPTAAELAGPVEAAVQVQIRDGSAAAQATQDGQPVDLPLAGTVVLRPSAPPVALAPLEAPSRYGDRIQLNQAALDDNGRLAVTLWWEALSEPGGDYTVFVHLLDEAGQLVAQADGPPNDGLSPTRIWQPGDTVRDVHRFAADIAAEPGWTIQIGWYDPATGERLAASQAGQPLPNNAYAIPVASR